MGLFVVYILKSALCLAAFYLFYRLLLSRETFHRFNRVALLGVLVLSCVLPLVEVSVKQPSEVGQTMFSLEQWLLLMTSAPMAETVPAARAEMSWVQVLLLVYVAGVVFFVLRSGYSLLRLLALLRSARREDAGAWLPGCHGLCLLVHGRAIAPFSWMRCVVISRKDLEEDGRAILTHEWAHIRRGHSWDLLLVDLCIFLQWFNPAAWLLKQELQSVHEYEADEAVVSAGVNAKDYQLLLIKKAVGTRLYSMANSFNHSKLKKRITMMTKKKSNPWARAKYLYVLPLAAIAVVAFARPEVSGVTNEIAAAKVSDLAAIVKGNVPKNPSPAARQDTVMSARTQGQADAVVYDAVDQAPQYPGGVEAMRKFLEDNVRHPIANTNSGTVIVQFVVNEDGQVVEPTVLRSLNKAFDDEALRLVASMPRWQPGMKDGKPVAVKFTLPIFFPSKLAERFSVTEAESPAVVVDGKLMEWNDFKAQVPPNRIESIIVLKGDKAAAYGTRGMENGVIVVKTKQIDVLSLRTEGDVPKELVDSVKNYLRGKVNKINIETVSLQSATGIVKGEDGEPMPGVIVLEAGTKHGTVTGKDGRFELRLSSPDAMLSLQYVGFRTLNVKAGTDLELVMKVE